MNKLIKLIQRKFTLWRIRPTRSALLEEFGNGRINSKQLHALDAQVLKRSGFSYLTILAALLAGVSAKAQTTTQVNNLFPTNGWTTAFENDLNYIEDRTNASAVQVEMFALRGTVTHDLGFGVNAYVPVGGTNSLFGAGVGFAYYNHNAYSTTLNAKLGGTISLPVIKLPVYTYVESGGGYDISKNEAIAQAFAGFSLNYQINPNWAVTAGLAIGTVSDVPGEIEAAGGSVTYTFP